MFFSRQLQVSPLKNKTGKDIVDAFSKLITLPKTLRTDGGSEFTNNFFQLFLKKNSIRHSIARNDSKAALAERVIQTLKCKIYQQYIYLRTKKKKTPKFKFNVDDKVRVSYTRKPKGRTREEGAPPFTTKGRGWRGGGRLC